jgi:DNA invertase Pin-like site-specific DNA recombinase
MAAVPKRGKPPFDVLVMSESSRLGRDMTRNAFYIVTLLEAGIEIHYYLTGEQERADTPEQKIVLTLRSYASEVERQKAGQRARCLATARQTGIQCRRHYLRLRQRPR